MLALDVFQGFAESSSLGVVVRIEGQTDLWVPNVVVFS